MPRPETRATLLARIADLNAIIREQQDRIGEASTARDDARRREMQAQKDNDLLRDQVHQLELDKARLEGQLERVRELEPLPPRVLADIERQDVADTLEVQAKRVRPKRYAPDGLLDTYRTGAAEGGIGNAATAVPYYRRRY